MDTRNPTRRTLAKAAAAAYQITLTEPVSDLLYGNFIELGFGGQIEGLHAEMFYNRSFEEIPPCDGAYGWIRPGYQEEPWRAEPASPQMKFQAHAKLWFRHGIAEARSNTAVRDLPSCCNAAYGYEKAWRIASPATCAAESWRRDDSPHTHRVDLDLADAGYFGSRMATTLSAADPAARNSLSNRNAISRTESHVVSAANHHTSFEAPPYCVSMIIFQQN